MAIVEQDQRPSASPVAVFVEGKSYGKKHGVFGSKDMRRMRRVARCFPGAILVFATLNRRVTRADKMLIRPLARAGRKPMGEDDWRNPVVVLTGQELFSESGPPYCWDDNPDAADIRNQFRSSDGLVGLADATQRLHLGMEPHDEYTGVP